MPSQLYKNGAIYFLAAKPFHYRDADYEIGDFFPQEEANNIETLIRARYVIPVVDDLKDKPRHWHTHVRTAEQAEEYLTRSRVQLIMPEPYHEPDSNEVVDLDVLTHPETTPDPTPEDAGEGGAPELEPEDPDEPTFDPGDHTVAEVEEYLAAHPEDRDRVLAAEEAGRARKGLVGD